jgi:hypothetical protein
MGALCWSKARQETMTSNQTWVEYSAQKARSDAEWLEVARKVNRGEYNKADYSTLKSITIGLYGMADKEAIAAVAALSLLAKYASRYTAAGCAD